MDILRKSLAPISQKAWEEINETAVEVLSSVLSARKIVDVEGPKGLDFAALSTGRIQVPANQKGAVKYGIHQVLPLVETRIPFELNVWELDNVARGAQDIDLGPMEDAARKIAQFEENAIYEGFKAGNIAGLKNSSDYGAIAFPENAEDIMGAITQALTKFKANSIGGPYTLVLNSEKWQMVNSFVRGYPLRKQLESLLGGSIILAPFVKDAYLVTERGGDLKMVIGQDISIGYESHNSKTVQLYFTESFTFQVVDPAAVIVLK
ncbi:MAG: bacteriocin family protein [Bacteroidales bacterium]|nr:bacteriocin family protein [Bacteroidales bacterium]